MLPFDLLGLQGDLDPVVLVAAVVQDQCNSLIRESGYIQVAVAYNVVNGPTTDTVTWSNVNVAEGAQIYTIALQ